jgi:hypothetical protein
MRSRPEDREHLRDKTAGVVCKGRIARRGWTSNPLKTVAGNNTAVEPITLDITTARADAGTERVRQDRVVSLAGSYGFDDCLTQPIYSRPRPPAYVGPGSAIKRHSPLPLDGRSDVGSALQTVLGLWDTNAGIVHRHRLSTTRVSVRGGWQTPVASLSFALIS